MNQNIEKDMANEENIRTFFHENKPETKDSSTFMVGLSSRMDALSEIREIQKQSQQRSRQVIAATFCIGIIVGIVIGYTLINMDITEFPASDIFTDLKEALDNTYAKSLAMLFIALGAITFGARYVKSLFSE